jgi:AhpD family alkylhydroperoxidase
MTDFTSHTLETASDEGKVLLEKSNAAFGRIPGMHAVMAEAPGLLEAYQVAHNAFANSSFTAEETTVVWLAINVENECHYCVPAHTGIAHMMKVDQGIIDALRDETPLPTEHLEALRTFTVAMITERGHLSDETVDTFLAAGYTRRNVLEVVLAYGQKIMSNYTNHLAKTPVDAPFEKFAWTRK